MACVSRMAVWACATALTAACEFDAQFGTPPDAGAPLPPLTCFPLSPSDGLSFGEQVTGRTLARVITVTNCSAQPRVLTGLELTASDAVFKLGRLPQALQGGQALELAAGERVGIEVVFQPQREVSSVGRVGLVLAGDAFGVPLTGSGARAPHVMPTVECSGTPLIVENNLVLSADTDPASPGTALALHGIDPGQCFEVLQDVLVIGTRLTDLSVLAGLTRVHGNLFVGHEFGGNAALDNVDGLANLRSVDGDITFKDNPALRTLDGLMALVTLGGSLTLDSSRSLQDVAGLVGLQGEIKSVTLLSNRRLRNLDGMEHVTALTGNLTVTGHDLLTSLDGLSGVTRIGGDVSLGFNAALKDLSGLSQVTQVGNYLGINSNASLGSLHGLASITSTRQLVITQNAALRTLEGLQNVVSSTLVLVSYNGQLTSLDALAQLSTVQGNLTVDHNTRLTHLGLAGLTHVGGLLGIHNNPLLPTAEANALAQQCGAASDIRDNAP